MPTRWNPERAVECQAEAEARACRRDGSLGLDVTYLYRFMEKTYAALDPYKYEWGNDDEYDFVTYIELEAFIAKPTPCGWTIKARNGLGWRFINKESRKQFALPTIELALQSYVARKERQASIYEARAKKARWCIDRAVGKTYILPSSA